MKQLARVRKIAIDFLEKMTTLSNVVGVKIESDRAVYISR